MKAEQFTVRQDGIVKPVQVFAATSVPISLGLLLDASSSMRGRRFEDALSAMKLLIREALAPGDEAFVMLVADSPMLVQGWSEKTLLENRQLEFVPGGTSPLFEAITAGVSELSGARHSRRVLLLITDGNPTDGRFAPVRTQNGLSVATSEPSDQNPSFLDGRPRRAWEALRGSEAVLYAFGIDSPQTTRNDDARPVRVNLLRALTDETGGYTETVRSSADLTASVRRLRDELKLQYLLGYASEVTQDGRYHKLDVRVECEGCRVRARQGFFAGRGL